MSISIIKKNFIEASDILDAFIKDNEVWKNIRDAGNKMVEAVRNGKKIITCGNGGSMCDAMHFAEELTGRFRNHRKPIPAMSISDSSFLTCTANDYGYDYIFARYIDGVGQAGDILVAISTSGNSPNMIEAARMAKGKDMCVIVLTGKDGGKLKNYADIEIRVPHMGYSDRIQEMHIKIIHSLVHYLELNLEDNAG